MQYSTASPSSTDACIALQRERERERRIMVWRFVIWVGSSFILGVDLCGKGTFRFAFGILGAMVLAWEAWLLM